jgi:hypothetical protein
MAVRGRGARHALRSFVAAAAFAMPSMALADTGIGSINGETLRLVGAVQGGGWVPSPPDVATGLTGELGVAGHIGRNPGVGFHTGLLVDTPFFLNAFVRAEWFLDEYSLGLGVRMLPTYWSAPGEVCPS